MNTQPTLDLSFLPRLYRWLARVRLEDSIEEATAAHFGELMREYLLLMNDPKAVEGDCIAKSRRIMRLVDDYMDKPSADTRGDLRKALLTEFMLLGTRTGGDLTVEDDIREMREIMAFAKPSDQHRFERIVNALRCNQLQSESAT